MQRDCVKCGHVNANAAGGSTEACPACGVIYSKALPPGVLASPSPARKGTPAWLAALMLGTTLVVALAIGTQISKPDTRPKPVFRTAPTPAQLHIADLIQKYEIAERSGDRTQACVSAMFVTSAHLNYKDETGYRHWLDVQQRHCR